MRTSEGITNLIAAMAKAQPAFGVAVKDKKNPYYNSMYADLAQINAACREPLAANGLVVMQPVSGDGETVTVTTRLAHVSGEWIEDSISCRPKLEKIRDDMNAAAPKFPTPNAIGSAVAYMRRYALGAMLNIVTDDDDGSVASGHDNPPAPPKGRPAKPPDPPPPGPNALDAKRRQTLLDTIKDELVRRYPGKDAEAKKKKGEALELLFGTGKWAEVQTLTLPLLEQAVTELRAPAAPAEV